MLLSVVPVGDEFSVVPDDESDQNNGTVAADAVGNFTVVWVETTGPIRAQGFDAAGTPVGDAFMVAATGSEPAVSMNSRGDFVVTWRQEGGAIYARRYAAGPAAQGSAFRVNSDASSGSPQVAVDDLGGFAVAWQRFSGTDGDVYARRYGSSGQALTSPFRVNTITAGNQNAPHVATDAAGNFVVGWGQPAMPGPLGLFAQRFESTGARIGSEFRLNSPGLGSDLWQLSMDADGDFVAVFAHQSDDGTRGIAARLFDRFGAARGEPFFVLAGLAQGASRFADPRLDMNARGDFVVIYRTTSGPFVDHLQGRLYDASGASDGEEFAVTHVTDGNSVSPGGVGLADNGTIAASWLYRPDESSDLDVYARVFTNDRPAGASVVGRHVFYNFSSYDGNDPGANAADSAAIATDKVALLPGQTSSFANVTNYARGINGVIIDLANLPPIAAPGVADFDFDPAVRPASITVRPGAGAGGSTRVTLVWDDYNPLSPSGNMATANGWLTVTLKATANTGLAFPDVFSFGNLVGETGDGAAGWRISALDLSAVKRAINSPTALTSLTDFNRDGRTRALFIAP